MSLRQPSDLRAYQNRIATFLYEHDRGIVVARPGAGKTAPCLTAIRELIDAGIIRHALVLAPKRVARIVWPDAIAEWSHLTGLRYCVLAGTPDKRVKALRSAGERDITIVGIDVVPWLLENLSELDDADPLFDLLVIDEISRLRNPRGVRGKALNKAAARWKLIWGMSGTLRPNGAADLYMPARLVVGPGLWGKSFDTWHRKHFYPTDYQGYRWEPLPGRDAQLTEQLAPYLITLADGDMPELPALNIVFDHVDLPPGARAQYDTMEQRLFAELDDGDAVVAASAAVATGKCAQMANGFIYDTDATTGARRTLLIHAAKADWLQDVIESAEAPTLLVYDFAADLDLIRKFLPDLPYLGAGVSDRVAQHTIDSWNKRDLPFMALHPASGGHGLNLQHGGADMAWLAPTWVSEYWEQTIARLHRSGQPRPVIVRVCTARATVDELKRYRVYDKMSAQDAFERYLRDRAAVLGRVAAGS
jgi:hypothetical protein